MPLHNIENFLKDFTLEEIQHAQCSGRESGVTDVFNSAFRGRGIALLELLP